MNDMSDTVISDKKRVTYVFMCYIVDTASLKYTIQKI